MRKLLLLLLGLLFIGVLAYFCFTEKAGGIKDDLASKAQAVFTSEQMDWVSSDIKGKDFAITRILTLNGVAPSIALKERAGNIAANIDGVCKVENNLQVANTQEITDKEVPKAIEKVEEVTVEKQEIEVVIVKEPLNKPEVVIVEQPAKQAISCQKEFKKIMSKANIHFEYDKANIKKDSYPLLTEISSIAKECPNSMLSIGGHTDWDGSKKYNKMLSKKRATAVMKYLISKGVSAKRVEAIGYGESKPIASNRTKIGQKKNRRIEFLVKGVK